jgi:hypothetical protein
VAKLPKVWPQVCLAKFLKVFKYKFEFEYFKPIFLGEKRCICGFANFEYSKKWVRKSQIAEKIVLANSKSYIATFMEEIFYSANFRICNLRNLFADSQTLRTTYAVESES